MKPHLDTLAGRAHRFLSRWFLASDIRVLSRNALWWLMAAPAALLLAQVAWALAGQGALPTPVWIGALASLAGPVLVIAARTTWRASRRTIDRRTSLGLFDAQLASKDRLVTADEFLRAHLESGTPMDRFKQAAIEDAAEHVEQGLRATLSPKPLPEWHVNRRSWIAVPAAAAAILAAVWLGRVAGGRPGGAPGGTVLAAGDAQTLPERIAASLFNLPKPRPRQDRAPDERTETKDTRSTSDSSPRSPRTDRDADGQSQAGGQANSRSSSQAMSSSGTPSNQQTPSQALEEDPPQEMKANPPTTPKKADGKKAEQQSTSATSGQGPSKSSSSDMNRIPATDQPDRAGANKDDGKDEDGIQDEVEEEKTAGVERPSLRRNKPPVDRNLSTRPTGDQPNPNANGRSGPGGRKKTRGVPAMILGVPTPDRIQGMSNPGRSKVTQEHSTPKEEPQAALDAEARLARDRAFGRVEHPLLRPWMQTLIETYFLQLRKR